MHEHDDLAALLRGCGRHHRQCHKAVRGAAIKVGCVPFTASPSSASLLVGYLRHPFPADARTLFDEMLRLNPVSWSALISGSALLGALALLVGILRSMWRGSWDRPNSFTLGVVSTRCARARGNVAGAQVNACTAKIGVEEEDESIAAVAVAKADMYAKCGWVVNSLWWAFTLAPQLSIVCWMWTSMIAFLINHGS